MPTTQATPAREWRKPREEGYLIELPSGHLARIGPVDLSRLLVDGDVPDLLTPLVTQLVFEGVDEDKLEASFSPEQLMDRSGDAMRLINAICHAAFIDPRIVEADPGEDEILIEDVSLDDRSFVFSIAIYGAQILRSFRVGQGEDVESVRDGEDDEPEAEPAPGD